MQLLKAHKDAIGSFPASDPSDAVPAAVLTPFLSGPIWVDGVVFNGVNGYNTNANNEQLALNPATPVDALLPTYAIVPVNDLSWNHPYLYRYPGTTGDYDLISLGADGAAGGMDKDADISANAEASLIATWFEYTPTSAMDIGITTNPPNALPPQPHSGMA